jgi:DNA-binding NarL/FixJ family response regulator
VNEAVSTRRAESRPLDRGIRSPARAIARSHGEDHALEAPFRYLTPEVSRTAPRHLDSFTTPNGNSQATLSESGTQARTVVIAGGHALVRATRRSVLSRAGLEVAADVADASRAAKAVELYGAGLVLVDSEISGGCILAVRRIAERAPGTVVLVVASELDHEALLAAVRAGADGFVSETLGASGLIRAVEVALSGDPVIPRAGVGTLIDQLRGGAQEQTLIEGLELQLTRREADVMKRRREGMTTKEIAYELDLSDVTIRRHLASVARKVRQARP